jgi:hypothetical protein
MRSRWKQFFDQVCIRLSENPGLLNAGQVCNLLVLTHGSYMRELFKFFIHDLECECQGAHIESLTRTSPNTSISKFSFDFRPNLVATNKEQNLTYDSFMSHLRCDFLNECSHLNDVNENKCDL